jgi:16S rRNA (cytidine1402-2'-O)-methyltransferase
MLYVVGTPIGNLGDMTPRAIETLRACSLIAAEDTRVTRKLLTRFHIAAPMLSNHRYNEASRAQALVARMLEEDLTVALVTDAGTPCISDPGYPLVEAAAEAGVDVLTVPGPTALAAALSVSGFDAREFAFYGFLPRAAGALREKLAGIARSGASVAVVYESPHRAQALLEAVAETLPGARVCLCCDLTKRYERTLRGGVEKVLAQFRGNAAAEKGEYCAVLELRGVALPEPPATPEPCALEARLVGRMLAGVTLGEAADALRDAGESRNEVYAASLRVKKFLRNADDYL